MSEMEQTFEQMLEASFKTIHTGEVVEGTVIDVKPDTAILNIGYKSAFWASFVSFMSDLMASLKSLTR